MSALRTRTVLWCGLGNVSDPVARRRRLLPIAGLLGTGWEAAADSAGPAEVDAMILDGLEENADERAWAAHRADVPIVLDAARAELIFQLRSDKKRDDQVRRLQSVARLASVVVVSHALPPVLEGLPISRIVKIPDVVETFARYNLALLAAGQPALVRSEIAEPAAALWFAEPDDPDLERELGALPALLPQLAKLGAHLTLLAPSTVPASALKEFKARDGVTVLSWSIETLYQHLASSRLLILPGSPGSANASTVRRARQAIASGLRVASASGPSVEDLSTSIVLDSWQRGLRQVLDDRTVGSGTPSEPHGIRSTAQAWGSMLDSLHTPIGFRATGGSDAVRLLIFVDHVTEADLCYPLIEEARTRNDISITVMVSETLHKQSPNVVAGFQRRGVEPKLLSRPRIMESLEPNLDDFDAFLGPVTTSHNAHKCAAKITERAQARGIRTYTMQHGLENLGISWQDPEPAPIVSIPSDVVFVWFPPDHLPHELPPALKSRLVHVGSVKDTPLVGPQLDEIASGPRIGVFENLHWNRYTDAFRNNFIAQLRAAAAAYPHVTFLLKPHPGGRFLSQGGSRSWPSNLVLLDPASETWAPYTAPALIAEMDAMITTPSTCALDGAQAGRPTAVAGGNLDLPAFEPLRILRSSGDWIDFIAHALAKRPDLSAENSFLARTLIQGAAAHRVINAIVNPRATAVGAKPKALETLHNLIGSATPAKQLHSAV